MADELKTILIKDLQEAESAADTDYIAIDNGTVTKKIRVDNYNKTANGTAKSYAESAKESADKAQKNADSVSSTVTEITNNITAAQSAAIQAEKSAEAAESATLNLQTYVNAAKESADKAKASEESTKNVADKIADSNKIAQSYAVGGTNYRIGEDTDNARYYYSGAKTAEANSETYKSNAAASESAAATSEINAKASAESATTSKIAAATSEQNASNSANYARANATRAESYAIGGTSSRSGEDTDNAKYYAQQAKEIAELAAAPHSVATSSSSGLMSAADKKAVDREFFRLTPGGGTYIPANADLNTTEYIKVGTYYTSASIDAMTMKNIPVGSAFIMYVLSPLSEVYDNESTGQWVYRLRIFITFTGNEIFVQSVSSGATAGNFSYDPWVKMTNSNDLSSVINKDTVKTVKVNGTALTPDSDRAVNITVPTLANNATTTAGGMALDARMGKTLSDQASQLAKNTAQIETAGTATNAHSVGEYVMISNALYKVTASVAKGDAWAIGTNVTAANVGSEIGSLKSDLANKLYPVGSIYLSVNATNPATLFGGTWEQIKDRFLLAAGDAYAAGSTGGWDTHIHKYGFQYGAFFGSICMEKDDQSGALQGGTGNPVGSTVAGQAHSLVNNNVAQDTKNIDNTHYKSIADTSSASNMPPYLAVYAWKRTA